MRRIRSMVIVALVAMLAALLGIGPAHADTAGDEWTFVDLLNQARVQAGLAPLGVVSSVRDVARGWSGQMAGSNTVAHNPNLQAQLQAIAPDWQRIGENVGDGPDAGTIHQAFMNSAGHRANILGDYNYVGIGVVQSGGTTWVTEDFLKASEQPTVTRVPVTRLGAGATDSTSVAVSQRYPSGQSDAVVVARNDLFPDALAGGVLAAVNHGPVLLTSPSAASPGVVQEAARVLKPGAAVYLLGGPNALAPAVEAAFAGAGLRTQRLFGADRYSTAVVVAGVVNPTPSQVFLVSGVNFPDAMVAAPAAFLGRAPIVLTGPTSLAAPTAAYLATVSGARKTVIGGTAVVSDAVAGAAGVTERVAGGDRYETAVKVAQRWFNGPSQLSVATGLGFQDALSGSPLSAQTGTPLLLSSAVPTPATFNYAHAQVLVSGIVYGTSGALPQSTASGLFG